MKSSERSRPLIVVALFAFAAGVAVGAWAGSEWVGGRTVWGSVADWFTGFGTLGLFALTYLLLRHEVYARRSDEEMRASEQANRVTVDVGLRVESLAENGHGPPWRMTAMSEIRNDSDVPITACSNEIRLGDRVSVATMDFIPPGKHPMTSVRFAELAQAGESEWPTAILTFTDQHGGRWRRDNKGTLTRLSAPSAERSIEVGMGGR